MKEPPLLFGKQGWFCFLRGFDGRGLSVESVFPQDGDCLSVQRIDTVSNTMEKTGHQDLEILYKKFNLILFTF